MTLCLHISQDKFDVHVGWRFIQCCNQQSVIMGFGMKLVYALVAMSLGIIVFGLYLIMSEPQTNEPTAPREIGLLPVPTPATESDVPQLDSEPGTEPWCDMMMQKPGDAWEEEETRIFADQCIYLN